MNIELQVMHESFLRIATKYAKKYESEDFSYIMHPEILRESIVNCCYYTDGVRPLCIVGVFLVEDLEASLTDLLNYDYRHTNGDEAVDDVLKRNSIPRLNMACKHYLLNIQYYQDQNFGWIKSANYALEEVR